MTPSPNDRIPELELRPVLPRSATPFYHQVKTSLLQEMESERLQPGDRLPGEFELARLFGVSRIVIRQALTELAYEGYIERRSGLGTFVAPKKPDYLAQDLIGLYDKVVEEGGEVRNEVRALEVVKAPAEVARELRIGVGDDVILLDRLRYVDGRLWVANRAYLPYPRFRELLDMDMTEASLYRTLRRQYAVEIVEGDRSIEVALASRSVAADLQIRRGAPVMILRSTSVDQDDQVVEHFVSHYDGTRARFAVHLTKGQVATAEFATKSREAALAG
jgi:GntR family transcriptional regulator